jgi:MFS family permease
MTGLQVLVSAALFAPGVMAPSLGIDATMVGLYSTATFAVGMGTSLMGGMLAGRYGAFRIATACAVAVFIAMGLAGLAGRGPLLVAAGLVLGCAFGPETPASSAVLGQVAPPAIRPFVFSIRQTGNQIGAMLGSLALPHIAAVDPRLGYAAIMVIAVMAVIGFEALRPTYDPVTRGVATAIRLRDAIALIGASREIGRLALVSVPYAAMQLALNAFLVIYAVERLGFDLVTAGVLLATAQGGGLVGRLAWGVVARSVPTKALIVGLGFAMSAAAMVIAAAGSHWPRPITLALAFVFGLSASGWNGIFLAEVARLAPEGRIAEATGAVLMTCYSGLVLGPLVVAGVTAWLGLGAAYAVLGAATFLGTLLLIGRAGPPWTPAGRREM